MKTLVKKTGGILYSLLQAIVGILLLIDPMGLTSGILVTFGVVLTVMGVVSIVNYFRTPIETASNEQYLMKGLLSVLVGCFCIFCTEWLVVTLPLLSIIYGVIMLLAGLTKVQLTFDALRKKDGKWFLGLISAAISIVCAVVVLTNPFTTTAVLWVFTGVAMIVDAVFDVFAVLFGGKKKKDETVVIDGTQDK